MIIGFKLTKVTGEKFERSTGPVQLTYGSKVDNIEEEEVKIYEDTVAKIDFTFNIIYNQNKKKIGEIAYAGSLGWKGNLKEIMKAWKDDHKMPDSVKSPILNNIYQKCLVSGVGLAESLGLPAPVPIPRIDFKNLQKTPEKK